MHPIRRYLVPGLALLLVACPGPSSPVDVEVLDYNPDSQAWELRVSTLNSVRDLNNLTGDLLDVVGNQKITIDVLGSGGSTDPAQGTVENMREELYENPGEPVQLAYDMVSEGGRQVAKTNDFESLSMLTVFHHFEKVWEYYRDVVQDQSPATKDHTLVGFYATVSAGIGVSIPLLTSDNAAFMPLVDSFLVYRIDLLQGIPLALNSGVITHEFSHRIFHHNVFGGDAFAAWYAETAPAAGGPSDMRSMVLLKALDEGTADINGVGFLRRPDFIADSLQGDLAEATRVQRDLEGPFADWADYSKLKFEGWSHDGERDVCGGGSNDYGTLEWNFYCLGTVWARSLWDASGRDADVLRQEILPAVNRALRRLNQSLANQWVFDFDIMLEHTAAEVAQGAPGRLGPLCAAFNDKFNELMFLVTTCP